MAGTAETKASETLAEKAEPSAKTHRRERRVHRRTRYNEERLAGAERERWRERQVWRYRQREERWMRQRSPWPFTTFGFW